MHLPTVKIKSDTPKGFRIINEADFKPGVHERYISAPPAFAPAPPPASVPPPPADPLASLPADWRDSASGALRELASIVSGGRTPENREQAVALIEQALAARQAQ